MSGGTYTDKVQMTLTIDGKEALNQLGKLEMEAFELHQEMKFIQKNTDEFIDKSKNLTKVGREYQKLKYDMEGLSKAGDVSSEKYKKTSAALKEVEGQHYRNVTAQKGELIKFIITGEGGGTWFLYANRENWQLLIDTDIVPTCEVIISGEIAWRIFTKGIKKEQAEASVKITGNVEIGKKIMDMIAVMA